MRNWSAMNSDQARNWSAINSDIEDCLVAVGLELDRAKNKFPRPRSSAHEGYAVLLEEVDEAWDAIKANDVAHAKKEMIQVAAMAIRFILEVK